jgi:hypothetical protein
MMAKVRRVAASLKISGDSDTQRAYGASGKVTHHGLLHFSYGQEHLGNDAGKRGTTAIASN